MPTNKISRTPIKSQACPVHTYSLEDRTVERSETAHWFAMRRFGPSLLHLRRRGEKALNAEIVKHWEMHQKQRRASSF